MGHKATEQIAELCGRISQGRNAVVVDDKFTKKIAGNRIIKILEKAGYTVEEKVISGAHVSQVNQLINFADRNHADLLLGVGGGSVIDVSKLAKREMNNG